MKKTIFFLAALFCTTLYAQDSGRYNEIYTKTYLETANTDLPRALKVADSLYGISETPLLQARSLMLSATLLKQAGEIKKSVDYALRSAEIIGTTDNYVWQAKTDGFLASQYRMLKLYNPSKHYLEKALKTSQKIENPKAANSIKGLMLQEKAYYEIELKNYQKAIGAIHQAQDAFKLTEANVGFFSMNNEQLLGLSYYHLKEYEKALQHYETGLDLAKKEPESFMTGLLYNGMAEVFLDQKDLQKAKLYLSSAEKISNNSQYLDLKEAVYVTSQKYYTATKDLKNLVTVHKKQDSVGEVILTKSRAFINDSFSTLEKNKAVKEEESVRKNWVIAGCAILLVCSGLYFISYRRKQKKKLEEFKKILKNLDAKTLTTPLRAEPGASAENISVPTTPETANSETASIMTADTEQKIIAKLEEFEDSQLFTQNTVSLATVATYCGTNSKYLSYIINSYKKKDFNNYINELRIIYIVNKLKEVPVYRKYKMAVLSEEAGFSSQNKFSTVFKKITSVSPSHFIRYLQETEDA